MPSSSHLQITQISDWIYKTNPMKVLDIGIGNGRYGFLSRDLLDTPFDENPKRIILEGIEGFEKYITDFHRKIYDNIYIGNCYDLVEALPNDYDLILFLDVIEHLDKEQGEKLIKILLSKTKNIIIATPCGYVPQDDVFGNEYERHHSGWTKKDFKKFENVIVKEIKSEFPYKLVCFIGTSKKLILKQTKQKKITGLLYYNRGLKAFTKVLKLTGVTRIKFIRNSLGLSKK